MTNHAMDFISETGDQPWLCHLSYIKPYWPYMAPAPYHDMYGPETFLPIKRDEGERRDPNPVFGVFMGMEISRTFSMQGARDVVMPAYLGLIKQIDDQLGRPSLCRRRSLSPRPGLVASTSWSTMRAFRLRRPSRSFRATAGT